MSWFFSRCSFTIFFLLFIHILILNFIRFWYYSIFSCTRFFFIELLRIEKAAWATTSDLPDVPKPNCIGRKISPKNSMTILQRGVWKMCQLQLVWCHHIFRVLAIWRNDWYAKRNRFSHDSMGIYVIMLLESASAAIILVVSHYLVL